MNFQYIKNLIIDIKELASSQFFIVILLFVQVGIVTRGLGTAQYGQAVLILTLIAIIFRSFHARNSDVTLLMLKKYGEKVYSLSLVFDLLIGVFCYLLCFTVFESNLNSFFGDYSMSSALNFYLVTRIFQTFSESSKAILTYNGGFKNFAFIDTTANLFRFIAIVTLFNFNANIDNYLYGQAVFSMTYGFISLFICRKYIKFSLISIKNLKDYYQKFKLDFLKQRFDQLIGIIPQHFDLVILGYFTDLSTVGIFRIAKRLVEPITYVVSILTPFVQNRLSKESIFTNFSDLVKSFSLPLSIIMIIPYIYFGEEFIAFISGPPFLEAYYPLLVLLIGYIVYLNTFWIRQLLLFSNLIQHHAYSRLFALTIFLIVSFIFTPTYGAVGLAIAVSASMIAQKSYEFFIYKKFSNEK